MDGADFFYYICPWLSDADLDKMSIPGRADLLLYLFIRPCTCKMSLCITCTTLEKGRGGRRGVKVDVLERNILIFNIPLVILIDYFCGLLILILCHC